MKLYILPLVVSSSTGIVQKGYQVVCQFGGEHWLLRQEFVSKREAELVKSRIGRFGFNQEEWELLK